MAISHVTLTDGVTVRRTRDYRRKKILGRRAPARGFPLPDWQVNQAALVVTVH